MDVYQDYTQFDVFAVTMQSVSALGLIFVASTIMCVRDKKGRVNAHPNMIVAQICLLQAVLYTFMNTASIPVTCRAMKHVWI